MSKFTKKTIIFSVLFLSVIILLRYSHIWAFDNEEVLEAEPCFQEEEIIPEKKDRILKIEIGEGDTYGALMRENGLDYALAMEIYDSAQELYDLIKIRQGRIIELVYDKDRDNLKILKYKIDSEDELVVSKINSNLNNIETKKATGTKEIEKQKNWQAEIKPIDYEIKIKTSGGVIESSMYQVALENDIDIRAIIELANAFQWSIDFAMDPRVGDEFKFIYEERFLDGEYINPGKVLGAYYVNSGERYELYYFEESEDNKGYFDQNGNSVQKMFLKAPVAFKYISSGYTTGTRVIMEFGLVGPHRAIDYAAAIGTPIRAVGDGTIVFAGWKLAYGNFTSIRHNGTYTTNYAHQSKFAVRAGQKVKQGDIIGYVGNTGYSTGPHLHYEMVKNGVKINPLKEILPPGKPIKEENRERFFKEIDEIRDNFEL